MILQPEDATIILGLLGEVGEAWEAEDVLAEYRVNPVEQEVLARYPDAATATGTDLITVRTAIAYMVAANMYETLPTRISSESLGDTSTSYDTRQGESVVAAWRRLARLMLERLYPHDPPTLQRIGRQFSKAGGRRG